MILGHRSHPTLAKNIKTQVPRSVALPFGTFERAIDLPENAAAAKELKRLLGQLDAAPAAGAGVPAALEELRALVGSKIKPPAELVAVRFFVVFCQ